MSLIPRFYDPNAGAVLIDGEDVRSFTIRSLRRQIGFVLQETELFYAPIWQNIAYGQPDATREAIIRAAQLAQAHEFIEALPAGYDTMVGQGGLTLSGGQRQRLGIARAMVRDAAILILDEPSSGLDAESERLVFEGLDRLLAGKTTFVIAHRMATIQKADLILVMDQGPHRRARDPRRAAREERALRPTAAAPATGRRPHVAVTRARPLTLVRLKPDTTGASAVFRTWVRLKPDTTGASAVFRTWVRLKPDTTGASAVFRTWVRLKPDTTGASALFR